MQSVALEIYFFFVLYILVQLYYSPVMKLHFLFANIVVLATSSVSAWTPSLRKPPQIKKTATSSSPSSSPPKAIAIPLDEATNTNPGITEEQQQQQDARQNLSPRDTWIANLDYEAFGKEVAQLGKELLQDTGSKDVEHLQKMVNWRNAAAVVGIATMWMAPNPLSVLALSTWTYASWTMIAHHTCHGGYNRVDAGKFNSRGFALGTLRRRVSDWLDWMEPEAWNIEHNRLHHYRLNELHDPDLVQRNLEFVRDSNEPMLMKYAKVFAFMPIWKWFYYAPNTFKELQLAQWKKETGQELPEQIDPTDPVTVRTLMLPLTGAEREMLKIVNPLAFFSRVVGPFFFMRFVLLPLPLLAIPAVGPSLFTNAMINLILAELLTNIHGFVTIVTNHAGEDLYTFSDAVKPKTSSFYVRQIVGSANYAAGKDWIDFSHGFLNYQIEHHVWPDLSMRQYQIGAPRLKAVCKKYGVPYKQESVLERLRKTVDIMVGKTTMRPFPADYEPAKDKALNGVSWKNTNGAIDE